MAGRRHARFAAFFRNLNLGRPNCPNRDQFESAFIDAGASAAASFLTNGTMVFDASSLRAAGKIVCTACEAMAETCGLAEPAFLRELTQLQSLVARTPFRAIDRGAVCDCYITFLHEASVATRALPRTSTRGDVELVEVTGTEVFSITRLVGKSQGSPNAFVEKTLARPATTRAWNTVVRLVGKHGTC